MAERRRITGHRRSRPTSSTRNAGCRRRASGSTLYRLDVGAAPIRMTQALTDGDGRVRDLLERPLAAGDYRLEFDVARGDEDGSFFTKVAVDLASPTRAGATTCRCCWRRTR